MDFGECCFPEESPIIACSNNVNCKNNLSPVKPVQKIESDSSVCENIKDSNSAFDFTNKSEKNSKKFLKESRKHLLSDSDDSFEIFLPRKNPILKEVVNPIKPAGKQKQQRTISKSRTCPYFTTKSVKSYFKPPSKSQEEKDLELALARSLLDVSGNDEDISKTTAIDEQKPVVRNSSLKLKSWTGKDPKKVSSKSLLLRRTSEDRSRIFTQKLAIVLLEKKEDPDYITTKQSIELSSSVLESFYDKNSSLWELSKLSVECYISDFYVSSLKSFIEQPSSSGFYSNSLKSDTQELPTSNENEPMSEIKSEILEKMNEISNTIKEEDAVTSRTNASEIPVLNNESPTRANYFATNIESYKVLSDNWSSLYRDKQFSDINLYFGGQLVPGHRLVFYSRCPALLDDINDLFTPNVIRFPQFEERAITTFLKYIYSGKTDKIFFLTLNEKRDLTVLAKKYNLPYLNQILSGESDIDSLYNQSTTSLPHQPNSRENSPHPGSIENIFKNYQEENGTENNFRSSKEEKTFVVSDCSNDSLAQSSSAKEGSILTDISRPFHLFSKKSSSLIEKSDHSHILECNSSITKRKLEFNELAEDRLDYAESSVNKPSSSKRSKLTDEIIILDSNSSDRVDELSQNSDSIVVVQNQQNLETESENLSMEFPSFIGFEHDENEYSSLKLMTDHKVPKLPSTSPRYKEFSYSKEKVTESCHRITSTNSLEDKDTNSPNRGIIDIDTTKKQLKKKSSLGTHLHTSFPSISLLDEIEIASQPVHTSSTPIASPTAVSSFNISSLGTGTSRIGTPTGEESSIIIKDATPCADYSNMVTPELKNELKKYGLKPNLEPRKAKSLLQYIYDQIHLGSPEQPTPSTSKNTKKPSVIEGDYSADKNCGEKQSNEFMYEESIFNENKSEGNTVITDARSLRSIVTNFLKNDVVLYTSVLKFEPLLINKFFKTLKDHGVHCSLSELMDTLDELCITYRLEIPEKIYKGRNKKNKKI